MFKVNSWIKSHANSWVREVKFSKAILAALLTSDMFFITFDCHKSLVGGTLHFNLPLAPVVIMAGRKREGLARGGAGGTDPEIFRFLSRLVDNPRVFHSSHLSKQPGV